MNLWVYLGLVWVVIGYLAYARLAGRKKDPSIADRLDPRKHWVQAAIALYQGKVGDAGHWSGNAARETLKVGWSTQTRDELLELIDRYIAGECNVGFDKLRIIWLARLGRGAGWLDDETSWGYAFPAVTELQRTYGSWPELFAAMKAGREEWYGGRDEVPAATLALNEKAHAYASKHFFAQVPYR
jgi:hypothetical protein